MTLTQIRQSDCKLRLCDYELQIVSRILECKISINVPNMTRKIRSYQDAPSLNFFIVHAKTNSPNIFFCNRHLPHITSDKSLRSFYMDLVFLIRLQSCRTLKADSCSIRMHFKKDMHYLS